MSDPEPPRGRGELGGIEPVGVGREAGGVGDEGEKEDEERRYSSSLLLWRPEPPRTPSVVP